jgi:hypothetical protein
VVRKRSACAGDEARGDLIALGMESGDDGRSDHGGGAGRVVFRVVAAAQRCV